MSHVNNLIHCVWGTKRRFPYLTPVNRVQIVEHIRRYSEEKGIYIDFINGHKDHIHCLLSLNPTQSLSRVVNLLKGESSNWISNNVTSCTGFSWANEYYAISVSPSVLVRVRNYIRDQDVHHQKRTWANEQEEFLKTIDSYSRQFRWDKVLD